MFDSCVDLLKTSVLSWKVLPAAFLLGILGSVTSCCNLPILGAVAGYTGAIGLHGNRRVLVKTALSFMIGTMCAFAILGAVGGFLGNIAGIYLGLYWKFLAGFISILFGLAVLGLLPFVSSKAFSTENWGKSSSGAILYGLTVGGGAATCSVFCSPVILVALTVAILQGHTLWGTAILMSFSIGYGLPVAGVLFGLGLGLGKLTSLVDAIKPFVQTAAGTMLIAVGFYLLSNY